MQHDSLILNGILAALIIFILWWFFGNVANPYMMDTSQPIQINVQNGSYQPALIEVPAGKPIKLHFVRNDPAPCADSIFFAQLNVQYRLPMYQTLEINLPPLNRGEIDFTCQAGTYKGKIIVL